MTSAPHILVVNGIKVRQPIFIIGAPHSGADLLARALKRSDGFHVTMGRSDVLELTRSFATKPDLSDERNDGAARVLRDAFARAWQINAYTCRECGPECRTASGLTSVGSCIGPEGVSRFGDASEDLLYSANLLADAFPDAKLIQIIRDGRDVVCDMLTDQRMLAWLRPNMAKIDTRFPNPFLGTWTEPERAVWREASIAGKCALRWRGTVRISARLRRQMPDEGLLTIRYEDLVADAGRVRANVADYLGAAVSRLDVPQRQRVGAWRARLSTAQTAEIERIAGAELTRLGYLT